MIKHICPCGYIYNPEYGDITADIEAGTRFEDLPEDWVCPICGLSKQSFAHVNKRSRSNYETLS
jgi:rubredoxin